jgi:hypothetical protein
MYIIDIQQQSVIRYYVLGKTYNNEIHTKHNLGYSKDILYQRTVDMWAARFRSGRTSVEDDDKPGRPSRDDFSTTVSDYLERNPHALCGEIAKDLFVPINAISQVLEEIGSRFFIARSMPTNYRLSQRRTE